MNTLRRFSFLTSPLCILAFSLGLGSGLLRAQVPPVNPIDPVIGPRVRIVCPPDHAVFYAPVDIPIFAYVVRLEGACSKVEFYAGTNDLGRGFDLGTNVPPVSVFANVALGGLPIRRLESLYGLVWTNPLPGNYKLTAVATFINLAALQPTMFTSAPVAITVMASIGNVGPTNIVNIVATDPIAIAGTNSWTWAGGTNATPAWSNWPPVVWQHLTNWGPKNALFTVHRFGDASSALTVSYSIAGTASNGVDYAPLPGSLTIPAGEHCGLIPIIPIDNGATNLLKTVVLSLDPSTNMPPEYLVGSPAHAAAIILEHWPRPVPVLLPDGCFHMSANAPDGAWFHLEYSSDLQNWTHICTNQVFDGSLDYIDPDVPGNASRFYRPVPELGPPTQ